LLVSTVVPRPIALATTIDSAGNVNAAPFSFFNAVSSVPPVVVLGISPGDSAGDGWKDTERNIRDTGEFVVNLVDEALAERMNVCAVDFPKGIGELEKAELHEMKEIAESLLRLRSIAQEMIEELERVKELLPFGQVAFPTGKMTILEIDFQEEKGFECLFPTLGPALDKLLARAFYAFPTCTEEEQRRISLECKMAKWRQWKEIIDSEITLFNSTLTF